MSRARNIAWGRYAALLSHYVLPQRLRFASMALCLLAAIGLELMMPLVTGRFIDRAIGGAASAELLRLGLGFMGLAIAQQVWAVAAACLGEAVSWTATNRLRCDLAEHALSLDLGYHQKRTPGEMIQRIDADASALGNFFSEFSIRSFGNTLLLLGIVGVLMLQDLRLGAVFLCFALGVAYLLNRVRSLGVPHQLAKRQSEAEMSGFLEERIAGADEVRKHGAAAHVLRRLGELQGTIFGHWRTAALKTWLLATVLRVCLSLGLTLSLVGGYWLYQAHALTLGSLYVLIRYSVLLGRPFRELAQQAMTLQGAEASVKRIDALRAIETALPDTGKAELRAGPPALVFDGVSFAYADNDVLRDVSLRLPAESVTAIIGRTGAGKSTLVRLAARLYDPSRGTVRFDDVALRDAPLDALRSKVAFVTQDVQLFSASIRDNLTVFSSGLRDAALRQALSDLGLDEWLESQKDGLDTVLAAGGAGLSAGEAQLLALGRAFLSHPDVVILDEAWARVDPITEARIERALAELLRGRTALIISHRPETISRCDRVVLLQDGRVLEQGTRSELQGDPASEFHRWSTAEPRVSP